MTTDAPPGCMSQGATRTEALVNIADAISLCLEVIEEDSAESLLRPVEQPGVVEAILLVALSAVISAGTALWWYWSLYAFLLNR